MGTEYVVNGARLDCTMGLAPAKLIVLPSRNVILRGNRKANIGDCIPFVNIPSFGSCKVTVPPKPCTPACALWMGGKMDTLVQGMPALLSNSFTICPAGGGVITISDSGQ